MAGCQAICSDIPILKEVYGSTVHYFTLHDINALSKLMSEVVTGKKKKRIPISLKKKYSWENAAKTIENILGGKK